MSLIDFMINQVFTQAPVFLGLVALVGLLLQRQSPQSVIEGTIKTVVGIVVLNAGIDVFLGSLLPLTGLLQNSFGVKGVMPDNFGPFGIAMKTLAQEISTTFILAFFVHLVIVRLVPWKNLKNVFLTGHVMLFTAAWFVVILSTVLSIKGASLTVVSGVLTGILWTVLPACARPFTREMTDDAYTLGHMQTFNVVGGSWAGRLFKGTKKSEEIELPGFLSVFSDYTVLLAVLMPLLYLVIGLIVGADATAKLSAGQHWFIWLIMQGIKFAAGVMIVLYGVRVFLAAIIPAFEGISQKVLPGAIPALDSPIFFPYAPVASIIGFLADAVAAILVTILLAVTGSSLLVVPGPIFVFFEGALAGVFGDRIGGWKGATAGGFLMGLITHLGAIPLYYLQGPFQNTGVQFGGADLVLLTPFFYLIKWLGALLGLAA